MHRKCCRFDIGAWRSLVARLFRVQEAVSSNLAAPTKTDLRRTATGAVHFFSPERASPGSKIYEQRRIAQPLQPQAESDERAHGEGRQKSQVFHGHGPIHFEGAVKKTAAEKTEQPEKEEAEVNVEHSCLPRNSKRAEAARRERKLSPFLL